MNKSSSKQSRPLTQSDFIHQSNNISSISNTYSKTINPNTIHRGQADTFSFKIPTSNLCEPLLVSIYSLSNDNNEDKYSSLLFVCNLYFDKLKLLKYLNIQEGNNAVYYTDESLNLILGNIYLEDKTITIENSLKSTLIPALIPKNVI